MSESTHLTGNPVFDYKAGFRRVSQSVQRILWLSGCLLIVSGMASLPFTPPNRAMQMTLRYAPLMGLALLLASGVWAYWWRAKLRADFRKEYS
jgi:hypothetical protein